MISDLKRHLSLRPKKKLKIDLTPRKQKYVDDVTDSFFRSFSASTPLWSGRVPLDSEVNRVARRMVKKLWNEGKLPCQISDKHWIAGYEGTHSFFGDSCRAIVVGPKPPSRFRDHYANFTVERR